MCVLCILVAGQYIIPSMVIEDFNGFSTQVRAGSMDRDSNPDNKPFNLNFGPNSLQIKGDVRCQYLYICTSKASKLSSNSLQIKGDVISA